MHPVKGARSALLNGPPGVGKSTCLQALMALLSEGDVRWAVVELDALTLSGPRPDDDPFGFEVALENLQAVANVYRGLGVARLCVGHVFTDREHVVRVGRALDDTLLPIVRLRASRSVVASRLRARHAVDAPWELDGFLEAHDAVESAVEEAAIDDFVINTDDLTPMETARQVATFLGWI